MTYLAITVLGRDRPGIIAEATGALAGCGMNLEDSSMTLLRGHFAMTLICAGDAAVASVEAALAPLSEGHLTIDVREIHEGIEGTVGETSYLLTVHGADRLGIVSRLAAVLAEAGGNITDLTTRLAGGLYVLAAEIDLPPDTDLMALQQRVAEAARLLGVDATLQSLERDEL